MAVALLITKVSTLQNFTTIYSAVKNCYEFKKSAIETLEHNLSALTICEI